MLPNMVNGTCRLCLRVLGWGDSSKLLGWFSVILRVLCGREVRGLESEKRGCEGAAGNQTDILFEVGERTMNQGM